MRYRAALRPDAVKQLVSIIFFATMAQAENEEKMHKSGTNGMKWRFAEQKSREKSRNVLLNEPGVKQYRRDIHCVMVGLTLFQFA